MNKTRTILVLDDDIDILKIVDKILQGAGFQVKTVQSAEEARRFLKTDIPHLIISDLNMEPEDGYSFITSIKKQTQYSSIPIIVLSAVNDYNSVKRVIGFGVNDYVVKPLSASRLLQKVRKALHKFDIPVWEAPKGKEPEIEISFKAEVISMGEGGYNISGPFKLTTGEELKMDCPELSSGDFGKLKHEVSSRMKIYQSGGNFLNEVSFIRKAKS